MITPDEFSKKTNISIGLLVACIIAAFSLGGTVATLLLQVSKIEHVEKEIEKAKNEAVEYTTQEVGGLRSDWDRDRVAQDKKIEKLEDKHIKE